MIDLRGVPDGWFVIFAFAGCTVLTASLWWISPRSWPRRTLRLRALGAYLLVAVQSVPPGRRGALAFDAYLFGAFGLVLPLMGRMPEDFPMATGPGDRSQRHHPRYRVCARRGLIVGLIYIGEIILLFVAVTGGFVRI